MEGGGGGGGVGGLRFNPGFAGITGGRFKVRGVINGGVGFGMGQVVIWDILFVHDRYLYCNSNSRQ